MILILFWKIKVKQAIIFVQKKTYDVKWVILFFARISTLNYLIIHTFSYYVNHFWVNVQWNCSVGEKINRRQTKTQIVTSCTYRMVTFIFCSSKRQLKRLDNDQGLIHWEDWRGTRNFQEIGNSSRTVGSICLILLAWEWAGQIINRNNCFLSISLMRKH